MSWATLGIDEIEGIDGDHQFDFDLNLQRGIRTVLRAHGQNDSKAFAGLVNIRLVRCAGRWKAGKLESAASNRKDSLRALSSFLGGLKRSIGDLGNVDQSSLAKQGIFALMNGDSSNALRNVINALQHEDLIAFLKRTGTPQIDQAVRSITPGARSIIQIGMPLDRLIAHVEGQLNEADTPAQHEGKQLSPTAACNLAAELLGLVDIDAVGKTLLNQRAELSRIAGKF